MSELNSPGVLTQSRVRELKTIWRAITGYQSDPPWYLFKEALRKNGLLSEELSYADNLDNVRRIARLQRELPKTGIPLDEAITYYLEIDRTIDKLNGRKMTGLELEGLIRENGIPLPVSTRSDWFSHLGGFQKKREYYPEQVAYILFRCSIFKAKKNRKEQKSKN